MTIADDPLLKPIQELETMYYDGNINLCLQTTLARFHDLKGYKHECLDLLYNIISRYSLALTHESRDALAQFDKSSPLSVKLTDRLSSHKYQTNPPVAVPGCTWFPAAATRGFLYQINLMPSQRTGGISRSLSSEESRLLDITGAALFHWLSRETGRSLLWNPLAYTFVIKDFFGKESHDVKGNSMGLGLALALFSLVTGQPVPTEFIATGAVNRSGTILPVDSMSQKLAVIQQERGDIKKVIIARDQALPESSYPFEFIRARHLSDVIKAIFPNPESYLIKGFDRVLDLEKEVAEMNSQYRAYILDTCMENAGHLIDHIGATFENETEKKRGLDLRKSHLFQCYWKLGSCYCHKGDIAESKKYLDLADKLYHNKTLEIKNQDYFEFLNRYGVLLKDIFCFEKAKEKHLKADKGLKGCGVLPDLLCKNLSSLSQLYLAQHKYDRALAYQEEALTYIRENEQHRNLGYLAQIYTRMGELEKAEKTLYEAKENICNISEEAGLQKQLFFFHWIYSEFLYEKLSSIKGNHSSDALDNPASPSYNEPAHFSPYDAQLEAVSKKYPTADHYTTALIQKFCGLGFLIASESQKGRHLLEKAQIYFDDQIEPMMRLLGTTVRIESIMAHHALNPSISLHEMRDSVPGSTAFYQEIHKIIQDLSMQKDIHTFFKNELTELKILLNKNVKSDWEIKEMENALTILKKINFWIPY